MAQVFNVMLMASWGIFDEKIIGVLIIARS
jgi:hypothetical protein